jgi:hypothetical protein
VIVDLLVKTKIPQFHRDMFYRTDDELTEFQYDWTAWSEQIIRNYLRMEQFNAAEIPSRYAYPKNTKSCFNYGTCPYLNLCLRDTTANRAQFVTRNRDYVEVPEVKK